MTAKEEEVIRKIRETSHKVVPPDGQVWLYGSRARGDAHEDSDWDILILLNKPKLEADDYGVAYPFRELGWDIGEEINPTLYSKQQWETWTYLPYYKNVERDKLVLL
ncbi:MAG: nucleotidyltransferase domain-containing protein [Bacteroidaceae bacterium]|nr:nucleotidyltransferase domain-containing protein [Bacteroidaceae bacterium]MBR6129757.1 nucleotidyltransferase domain-containing protein [Bacteroidaceae bacterium]